MKRGEKNPKKKTGWQHNKGSGETHFLTKWVPLSILFRLPSIELSRRACSPRRFWLPCYNNVGSPAFSHCHPAKGILIHQITSVKRHLRQKKDTGKQRRPPPVNSPTVAV